MLIVKELKLKLELSWDQDHVNMNEEWGTWRKFCKQLLATRELVLPFWQDSSEAVLGFNLIKMKDQSTHPSAKSNAFSDRMNSDL